MDNETVQRKVDMVLMQGEMTRQVKCSSLTAGSQVIALRNAFCNIGLVPTDEDIKDFIDLPHDYVNIIGYYLDMKHEDICAVYMADKLTEKGGDTLPANFVTRFTLCLHLLCDTYMTLIEQYDRGISLQDLERLYTNQLMIRRTLPDLLDTHIKAAAYLHRLAKHNEALSEEVKLLRKSNNMSKEKNKELKIEIKQLLKSNNDYLTKNKQLKDEVASLTKQAKHTKRQPQNTTSTQAQQEVNTQSEQLSQLKDELHKKDIEIANLRLKVTSLTKQLDNAVQPVKTVVVRPGPEIGYFRIVNNETEFYSPNNNTSYSIEELPNSMIYYTYVRYDISTNTILNNFNTHFDAFRPAPGDRLTFKRTKTDGPPNIPPGKLYLNRGDKPPFIPKYKKLDRQTLKMQNNFPDNAIDGYVEDIIDSNIIVNCFSGERRLVPTKEDIQIFDYIVITTDKEILYTSDNTSIYEADTETQIVCMLTQHSGFDVITDEILEITNNTNISYDTSDIVRVSSLTKNVLERLDTSSPEMADYNPAKQSISTHKVEKPPITDRIVIVGNPGYYSAYSKAFSEIGVSCIVLDGYMNPTQLLSTVDQYGKVIMSVNFMSHNNMWDIKEKSTAKWQVVKRSGASSMVRKYKECFA